jgi:hypothetical protein
MIKLNFLIGMIGGGYSEVPQEQNNVNDNTYGCIRMENSDVNELGNLIENNLKNGVPVTLPARDENPKKDVKNK